MPFKPFAKFRIFDLGRGSYKNKNQEKDETMENMIKEIKELDRSEEGRTPCTVPMEQLLKKELRFDEESFTFYVQLDLCVEYDHIPDVTFAWTKGGVPLVFEKTYLYTDDDDRFVAHFPPQLNVMECVDDTSLLLLPKGPSKLAFCGYPSTRKILLTGHDL